MGLWCGHNHRPIETVFGGVPASIIAGVAHQVAFHFHDDREGALVLEPPAFKLHHFDAATGIVSHTVCVENFPGPYPFVLDPDYPGQR